MGKKTLRKIPEEVPTGRFLATLKSLHQSSFTEVKKKGKKRRFIQPSTLKQETFRSVFQVFLIFATRLLEKKGK